MLNAPPFFVTSNIMGKIKVKEIHLGVSTHIKGLGRVTLRADHADMLFKLGLTAYLDGIEEPKKLIAKVKKHKIIKQDAPDQDGNNE